MTSDPSILSEPSDPRTIACIPRTESIPSGPRNPRNPGELPAPRTPRNAVGQKPRPVGTRIAWRTALLSLIVPVSPIVCSACASGPRAASKPNDASARDASSSTELSEAASEAHRIAAKVATLSGLPDLGEVARLDFTFVVVRNGERALRVEHRWNLIDGLDRLRWTKDGHVYDALLTIATRTAEGTVDGQRVAGPAADDLGRAAYARFINDSYWLMMPLKLFDPGVRLDLEAPRTHEGLEHHVLRLSFQDVGLTPGDVYWLFIQPVSNRIVRWEMKLEGQIDPPRGMSWDDYRPVGPLLLAHAHRSDDGRSQILFEDTKAWPSIDTQDFRLDVPSNPASPADAASSLNPALPSHPASPPDPAFASDPAFVSDPELRSNPGLRSNPESMPTPESLSRPEAPTAHAFDRRDFRGT